MRQKEKQGRGDFCVCREGAAGVGGDRQGPSLNQRNYSQGIAVQDRIGGRGAACRQRGGGGGMTWWNQFPGRKTRSECCSWALPCQDKQTKVCGTTCVEFQFPAPQHNALSVFKDL